MSAYEPKHDQALLAVPWLAHPPWLFKYAPHPDRAGYVFLATNLEVVLFESLTAPSIPSRLQAIASSQSQSQRARGTASQRPEGDLVRQAEGVLGRLEGEVMVLGGGWEEVEVDVREHAFYDRVVEITAIDFHWTFNMTELPPPPSLSIIRTHLLGPLAALIPGAKSHPNTSSTVELLGALLTDSNFAKSLVPPAKLPSGPSSNVRGRVRSRASPVEEEVEMEQDDPAAQTQELVPETLPQAAGQDGAGDGVAEDEEEEYRSPEPSRSPSPPPRRSSRSRATRGGHADDCSNERSDSPGAHTPRRGGKSQSKRPDEAPQPPDPSPPATTRTNDNLEPRTNTKRKSTSPSPGRVPAKDSLSPSIKKQKAPSAVPARTSRSASPVKRAREIEPTPTQSSQKSKKEREKEEEEMMERRMEEMKRKMGSGAGGRLGRRRAGR